MESMNQINKCMKLGQLNEVNNTLKRYGTILLDIQIDKTNKRYTTLKYRGYYFRTVMQHGETLEVTKSNKELDLFF